MDEAGRKKHSAENWLDDIVQQQHTAQPLCNIQYRLYSIPLQQTSAQAFESGAGVAVLCEAVFLADESVNRR